MSNIWVPTGEVHCPLCDEPFKKRNLKILGKTYTLFFCRKDKISIYSFDKAFKKWRETNKVVKCPNCEGDMKWFMRFMDGYYKAVCPVCKICVEKDSKGSITEGGGIDTEDLEEKAPEKECEDMFINIPVDKLKIPEGKKAYIKKEIRRKWGDEKKR